MRDGVTDRRRKTGELDLDGLARAGRQREERTTLDGLRDITKPYAAAPVRVALVHTALGETDRAFDWLEKGSRRGTGR